MERLLPLRIKGIAALAGRSLVREYWKVSISIKPENLFLSANKTWSTVQANLGITVAMAGLWSIRTVI